MDSLVGFFHSLAKVLPVGFASRSAFVGVLVIAVAGGFHEHKTAMDRTTTSYRLEEVQQGIEAAREVQLETKKELNERLDRLEAKVDRLLLERRPR